MTRSCVAAFIFLALLSGAPVTTSAADDLTATFSTYTDGKGTISLPRDFRHKWAHLGTWVVPDEKAPGYGFHDVYTQPESAAAYKKAGEFPDGAVIVKDIRKVRSADQTTGKASWAGDTMVWFVMIKDRKGRFSGNPNWGEGWGWALFKAEDPGRNVSTSFRNDCIGCHVPAKKTDWVYIEGYPTLH